MKKRYALLLIVTLVALLSFQAPIFASNQEGQKAARLEDLGPGYWEIVWGSNFSDSYSWNADYTHQGNYWTSRYIEGHLLTTRLNYTERGDWIKYNTFGAYKIKINACPFATANPSVRVIVNGTVVGTMNLQDTSPEVNDGHVHVRPYYFSVPGGSQGLEIKLVDDYNRSSYTSGAGIYIESIEVWVPELFPPPPPPRW